MFGFQRKSTPDQSGDLVSVVSNLTSTAVGWLTDWGRPTRSGPKVNTLGALGVASIWAAVRVISDAIASTPINLLEEVPAADGQFTAASRVVRNHWAAKLMDRPGKRLTGRDLKKWVGVCLAIHGECALLKITVDGGRVVQWLQPIPNGAWERVNRNDPESQIAISLANGTRRVYSRDDFVILTLTTLDGINALSPVMLAAETIGLTMAFENQQSAISKNGGRPSGFFTAPPGVEEAEVNAVREGFQLTIVGGGGEASTPFFPEGWQHHKLSFSAHEQQIIESRAFQVLEIARVMGVPAYMIEGGNNSSYASSDVATRVFVQNSIKPYLVCIEEGLTLDLLRIGKPAEKCENLRYDADDVSLMRGSPDIQAKYFATALGAGGQGGWLTVNEVRAEQGRSRINEPWADTVSRGAMDPAARARLRGVADGTDGLQLLDDEEKKPDA